MKSATLTSKGQITIPQSIRKMIGLSTHQKVLFIPKKESVELVPLKGDLLDLYGTFHAARKRPVKDWSGIRLRIKKYLVAQRTSKT